MAYTYNDVQSSKAVHALDDAEFESTNDGLDQARWAALEKTFMPGGAKSSVDMGTDSVLSASDQGVAHITSVTKAVMQLSEAQSVANIHVLNDNFIRDSITGK